MKKNFILIFTLVSLAGCATKSTIDPDTLPKDAALKQTSQEQDTGDLAKIQTEINGIIAQQPCTNPADWRISPIGSKSCGGPAGYLAYPIKSEDKILPKIKQFTELQKAFNKKYGIVSDCSMVVPPTEVKCDGGQPKLLSSSGR